ncbi:MAG TPA: hypothetical protein VFG79_02405 [Solirubrobacter sp.]|nr:hypothetical protein [Solirubrobacter sp.]
MRSILTRFRRRLTFANVASVTALFVALGGTSYAAVTLPRDSVGSEQIKYHGIANTDIEPNAVRAWQIRKDAVGRSEIRPQAVRAWEIAPDAVGPSEIRDKAVSSDELADGGIEAADLSAAAKASLSQTIDRAAVTKAGAAAGGNATSVVAGGTAGTYIVTFARDVSACQYTATPAVVKNGTSTDTPDAAATTAVAPGAANTQVVVTTYKPGVAEPTQEPFNLLVAC